MKKTLLGFSAAAFVVIACGGGNANENTNTTTNPPAQDAAAPMASSTPAQDAGVGSEKPNLEAQRTPFVQACMRKMPAQPYCDCAFDQFKDVFKDSDLTSKPTDAQMESLKQKTVGNCSAKLTETDVKTLFGNECVGGNAKKQAWCDCEYGALRSKLQLADFLAEFDGPKYDDAKKAVVTQCKGKLTEDVEKADFAQACSKGVADRTKTCDCIWKKLRSKLSVEEIGSGAFDPKKAGLETCKTQ